MTLLFVWCNSLNWTSAASFLRFLDHTQLDTPQPIGLLCTGDQLITGSLPTQHKQTQKKNINALSGIQTHDASNQAAVNQLLRMQGHRNQPEFTLSYLLT